MSTQSGSPKLRAHSGEHLYSAAELIAKAVLESPRSIDLLCGPVEGSPGQLIDFATSSGRAVLLEAGCRVMRTPTAERAIALAAREVRFGSAAVVVIPNDELDRCMHSLHILGSWDEPGGAVCLILEDAPDQVPAACPRRAAIRLGIPCLEAPSLGGLKRMVGDATQLSDWNRTPAAVVVHQDILRSTATIAARPNRSADVADLALAKVARPRRLRTREGDDLIRAARRLDLNELRGLPNPGDRAKYAFITVGPADDALTYLTTQFGLHHRVATLRLDMLHPIDEAALGRFLERCENAIVLEPRPGSVEPRVLLVAETMRQTGLNPALVWARKIPDTASTATTSIEAGVAIHPSRLVRRVAHLFAEIRPDTDLQARLLPSDIGSSGAPTRPHRQDVTDGARLVIEEVLDDVERHLRDEPRDSDRLPICLVRAHMPTRSDVVRLVDVEIWTRVEFLESGIPALSVAARSDRPLLMIVLDAPIRSDQDIERLARAAAPDNVADRIRTAVGNLNDIPALRDQMVTASHTGGVFVLIVRDGPPARYDLEQIERDLEDVDRLGYLRSQRIIWPASESCVLRPPTPSSTSLVQRTMALESGYAVEELPGRIGRGLRIRLRILAAQAEVTRSRPPTVSIASGSARLPLPKPIHGELPHWRVHVAGYRGSGAGVCAEVLARAGRLMGYRVAGLHDPTLIGPGLRAWAQLHFASGETRDRPVMIARTPFGEANVLIGVHADETARAVEPAVGLSVASPQRTSAVVNEGGFVGILGTEMPSLGADQFKPALEQVTRPGHVHTADFSDAARHALHTDRLTDAVMIGYAFQLGLIPVTLQAIETAIDEVQRAGFGRLAEAFAVGRRLAHRWPRTEAVLKHRHSVPAEIRRYARMLRSLPWRGRQRAAWYQTLVARTVEAMPGLTESDAGRQSQVDLARAVYRCFLWGGIRCAEQYTTLMLRLYEKDRGDTGRALTRDAILPVADAMLMRDPLYMATMSLSGEEKRRIRQRMNVKLAREDTLEQRFLTRIEAIALRRRVRVELRTSAWLIRLVSFSRHLVPHRWRGTHRKRELRRKMLAFVHAIIAGDGRDYGHCAEAMHKLNQLALSDELHVLPVTVLDSIIGGVQKPDSEDPSSDRDS